MPAKLHGALNGASPLDRFCDCSKFKREREKAELSGAARIALAIYIYSATRLFSSLDSAIKDIEILSDSGHTHIPNTYTHTYTYVYTTSLDRIRGRIRSRDHRRGRRRLISAFLAFSDRVSHKIPPGFIKIVCR